MEITPKQLLTEAIFNPLKNGYSKKTKVIALVTAIAIGILSAGIFFLVLELKKKKFKEVKLASSSSIQSFKIAHKNVSKTQLKAIDIVNHPLKEEEHRNFQQLTHLLNFDYEEYINKEKVSENHKKKLIKLNKTLLNHPYKLLEAPSQIDYFAKKATFYSYNSEGINDVIWGCAWRAIQTCLSALDTFHSYEKLFYIFGPKEHLKTIFENKYPQKELDMKKKICAI